MRWMPPAWSLLLLLLASGCASVSPELPPPAAAPGGEALVITGVSIIDSQSGAASPPSDIIIEGGLITAIAPAGASAMPAGTRHLDGAGRFAMPGLIDVHAHLGEGGITPASDETRERALEQFLRYGVTTIFVPGAGGASDADFPELRGRCRSGAIACPGLHGSGSLITAPGSHPVSTIFQMPDNTPAEVTAARGVTVLRPGMNVDALVAEKVAAGADAIKVIIEDGPPPWFPKPRLSDEQVASIVRAAHARGVPVVAHISTSDHVRVALEAGVDGIMHAPTDRLSDELIGRMAEQRMWYVPTFALYDGILTWARGQREPDPFALKGVEPSAIESLADARFLAASPETEAQALAYLESASGNLKRAILAGVPIAMGSDVSNPFVFPGYSAHEELVWMVKAGLTPAQALQAATGGSAAFLSRAGRIGRIAPGYEADLVLLSRNPLERIENSRTIVTVLADGKIIPNVASAD